MKLVDDAKKWWRMLSMQAMGAAVAIQVTWAQLPDDLKSSVPHAWVSYGTAALLVLGMVGRLVKQSPKDKP